MAISGDGKRIVSGSWHRTPSAKDNSIVSGRLDQTLKVWDADKGIETISFKGHTGPVSSVAISADGKRIVSMGWEQTLKADTLKVWNADNGIETLSLTGPSALFSTTARVGRFWQDG